MHLPKCTVSVPPPQDLLQPAECNGCEDYKSSASQVLVWRHLGVTAPTRFNMLAGGVMRLTTHFSAGLTVCTTADSLA